VSLGFQVKEESLRQMHFVFDNQYAGHGFDGSARHRTVANARCLARTETRLYKEKLRRIAVEFVCD